jgi:sulfofructose kinase
MITGIGISTLDHFMTVDSFHGDEGTYAADSYNIEGGGVAATAMCAAAKLGSETRLISRVGDDVNGQHILERLKTFNIDTSHVRVLPGVESVTCFILVEKDTGEKQFYLKKPYDVFEQSVTVDDNVFDGTTVMLIDGQDPETSLQGLKWAKKHDVPVIGDFKRHYPGLDTLMPYITHLIIPEFFAAKLTGETSEEQILESAESMINGIAVLTQGSRGGMYLDDGDVRRYPVFPVDVVDSTGAGDAFHGVFCHFLDEGQPLEILLKYASAAGAMNCRKMGGRAGLPGRDELEEMIRRN